METLRTQNNQKERKRRKIEGLKLPDSRLIKSQKLRTCKCWHNYWKRIENAKINLYKVNKAIKWRKFKNWWQEKLDSHM